LVLSITDAAAVEEQIYQPVGSAENEALIPSTNKTSRLGRSATDFADPAIRLSRIARLLRPAHILPEVCPAVSF
jgi:hypothetical protein